MTTTAEASPTGEPDDPEFLPTGKIRTVIEPDWVVVLRRPKFGEARYLRAQQADLRAKLDATRGDALSESQRFAEEAARCVGPDGVIIEDHRSDLESLRDEAAASAARMRERADVAMGEFWVAVFRTLAGIHDLDMDDLPAWCLDPGLPKRAIDHMTMVPTGRG